MAGNLMRSQQETLGLQHFCHQIRILIFIVVLGNPAKTTNKMGKLKYGRKERKTKFELQKIHKIKYYEHWKWFKGSIENR